MDALHDFKQNQKESAGRFAVMKEYKRCQYTNGTNVMEDIYELYRRSEINFYLRKESLERTIEKRQQALDILVREHEKQTWVDLVLNPLADIVSRQMAAIHNDEKPWPYKIYGPFGLRRRTTVYIFPEGGEDIMHDETYILTVFPVGELGKNFCLTYDTGKLNRDYQPGTLDDVDGSNCIREKLPDRLGEIIAKFRHHPARKKPEEKQEVTGNE